MDRYSEITEDDEEVDATLLLTGEHLEIVMKALDCYAYAMVMSQSVGELNKVKEVAEIIISNCPRLELDS